jgi:predicted phage tail protein
MAKKNKETKKQEIVVTKLNSFEDMSAFLDEAKAKKKKKASSVNSSWMDYDDGYGAYGYMGGA